MEMNKFLIVGNTLYMGKVQYHYELIPENNQYVVHGGGCFHHDEIENKVLLYSHSYRYKIATEKAILNALENTDFTNSRYTGCKFYISSSDELAKAMAEVKFFKDDANHAANMEMKKLLSDNRVKQIAVAFARMADGKSAIEYPQLWQELVNKTLAKIKKRHQ